jgi:hypothetical protein
MSLLPDSGERQVILGGVRNTERQGVTRRIFPPIKLATKRRSVQGWCLAQWMDYGVRQIYFGTSQVPTATWKATDSWSVGHQSESG